MPSRGSRVRGRAQRGRFIGLGLILSSAAGIALHSAPASAAAPALSLPSGPLVQLIDTNLLPDHADISVQFSCSTRYITNTPSNYGSNTRITLRLGPDCGSLLSVVPPEFPQVSGGGELVTNARLESTVPG